MKKINLTLEIKEAFQILKKTILFSDDKIIKNINKKIMDELYLIKTFLNGTIKLEDKIIVADPSLLFKNYDDELLKKIEIVPGEYDCYIELLKDSLYKPSKITLLNKNAKYKENFEYYGSIYVTSGCAGIFNNSFYEEVNSLKEDVDQFIKKYDEIVSITYNKTPIDKQIVDDKYILSDTSYGDGWYVVFVEKNNNDQVIGIQIDYTEDVEKYI